MDALEEVGPGGRILFSKSLHEEMVRHEIVVTFLAILELMKMKQILCYQEKLFEDIVMEWRGKDALMDYPKLKSIIEGLLFLSGEEGLSVRQIAEITEQSDGLVGEALEDMKEEWERHERGIQIVRGVTKSRRWPSTLRILSAWRIRLPAPPCRKPHSKHFPSWLIVNRLRA